VRSYEDEDASAVLREPKGPFQQTIRRLADAAMSVTHHDAAAHEPGYIHEVQAMERRFSAILRGKLVFRSLASPIKEKDNG
jgi:hypothetical protein